MMVGSGGRARCSVKAVAERVLELCFCPDGDGAPRKRPDAPNQAKKA